MDVIRLRRPDWLFVHRAGHSAEAPLAAFNHINPGAAPGYVYLHCERYEDNDINGLVLKIERKRVDDFIAVLRTAAHMHDEHWKADNDPK